MNPYRKILLSNPIFKGMPKNWADLSNTWLNDNCPDDIWFLVKTIPNLDISHTFFGKNYEEKTNELQRQSFRKYMFEKYPLYCLYLKIRGQGNFFEHQEGMFYNKIDNVDEQVIPFVYSILSKLNDKEWAIIRLDFD